MALTVKNTCYVCEIHWVGTKPHFLRATSYNTFIQKTRAYRLTTNTKNLGYFIVRLTIAVHLCSLFIIYFTHAYITPVYCTQL